MKILSHSSSTALSVLIDPTPTSLGEGLVSNLEGNLSLLPQPLQIFRKIWALSTEATETHGIQMTVWVGGGPKEHGSVVKMLCHYPTLRNHRAQLVWLSG